MSPLGEAFRRAMEKRGAPLARGGGSDATGGEALARFASAPTQEIPAYPSAPPAGALAGDDVFAAPGPGFESDPPGEPQAYAPQSGASAFLSRAARVATFAEGPLEPGCDELAGLRAALLSLGLGATPATVMVAGASAGEATTAVAAGLAGELARGLAHRVLLLDANVARPGVARMLDVDPELELADVLEGRAFAGEAMVHSETDNLSVLVLRADPIVGRSRATAESFMSDVARQAVTELQAAFDYVVVDAGSVERSAAARVLAARATGTVLVLGKGVSRDAALAARRAVESAGGRVLGAVLAVGRGEPRRRTSARGGVTGAFVVPGAGSGRGRGL